MTDDELTEIDGIGPAIAEELRAAGYHSADAVREATVAELADVHLLGESSAAAILDEGTGDGAGKGRPSKLERMDETKRAGLISDIATVIEDGGSISEAARKTGIHRETIGRWMEKGADADEGPFAEFHDRLVRARGEGEGKYRQALMDIAVQSEDTATLMAMLKQRYPESWGDVDRGEQAGGVVINLDSEDEYEVDPETLEIVE